VTASSRTITLLGPLAAVFRGSAWCVGNGTLAIGLQVVFKGSSALAAIGNAWKKPSDGGRDWHNGTEIQRDQCAGLRLKPLDISLKSSCELGTGGTCFWPSQRLAPGLGNALMQADAAPIHANCWCIKCVPLRAPAEGSGKRPVNLNRISCCRSHWIERCCKEPHLKVFLLCNWNFSF